MKEQFETLNMTQRVLDKIALINSILAEYQAMGYRLTIRQLFYQLVARGHLRNTVRNYKRVIDWAGKGRMAGLIDWAAIEDRGRTTIYPGHWKDPADLVEIASRRFRVDRWKHQPNMVVVMLEKMALAGVLEGVCSDLDVRLIPNRGYSSLSEFYKLGQLFSYYIDIKDKELYLLYLGDHDPSGLDMDRDIQERLSTFSGHYIDFQRLALTMEQIEEYDPPPDPAKLSDSRAWAYISEHGHDAWELDALEPQVLHDLVEAAVLELRDEELHQQAMDVEEPMKEELVAFVDEYNDRKENGDIEYLEDW